jgi:hypothetical protein
MISYDKWKLQTPDSFQDEEEIEIKAEIEPLEQILDHMSVLCLYNRKKVLQALKCLLSYSKEPGINLADVHQLLDEIIENI